ncbi:penicillin-binding protein 2 [bacterium]|nr:penicillin-binding protein 2 [bacterium]
MWQIESNRFEYQRFKNRAFLVKFFLVFVFFVLYLRLFQLQIINKRYFKKISKNNCIQILFQQAPRGAILDRNGVVLADSRSAFSLLFSPFNLSDDDITKSVNKISDILDRDKEYFIRKISFQKRYPFTYARLMENIERKKMFQFAEEKPNIPGITIQTETVRYYLRKNFASHILGYIGEINADELRDRGGECKQGNVVGKIGIEKIYDSELRGIEGGKQIEVNAVGRELRVLREIKPVKGHTLILTIDKKLQELSEDALGDSPGVIIILDPRNSEVLSLVSKPDFDSNIFTVPLASKKWNHFFTSLAYPLLNRAIQAQYAPGSVFKILVTLAALEEEKINLNDTFFCKGFLTCGREERVFRCWKREGHGKQNLIQAMANSCDIYFYNMGLSLGVRNISKYAKEFGLGEKTGIDLPSEKRGLVPSSEWKRKKIGDPWFDGDTLNLSIGQGYLLATPLQIANMVCAVVNGGKLYRPYIVKKIIGDKNHLIKEIKPYKIRDIKISESTLNILKKSLKSTVEKGTGRAAYLKNLSIGGKTGTAENPHGENHAWFVCFTPVEDPQIVICVFLEHGGSGGSDAAPVARKVLEGYAQFLNEHKGNEYILKTGKEKNGL